MSHERIMTRPMYTVCIQLERVDKAVTFISEEVLNEQLFNYCSKAVVIRSITKARNVRYLFSKAESTSPDSTHMLLGVLKCFHSSSQAHLSASSALTTA